MKKDKVGASGKRGSGMKGMAAARRQARSDMAEMSAGWRALEEWERKEWRKKANGPRNPGSQD
jgi:hypothetical protein